MSHVFVLFVLCLYPSPQVSSLSEAIHRQTLLCVSSLCTEDVTVLHFDKENLVAVLKSCFLLALGAEPIG